MVVNCEEHKSFNIPRNTLPHGWCKKYFFSYAYKYTFLVSLSLHHVI